MCYSYNLNWASLSAPLFQIYCKYSMDAGCMGHQVAFVNDVNARFATSTSWP
jgi:hypothetical protein